MESQNLFFLIAVVQRSLKKNTGAGGIPIILKLPIIPDYDFAYHTAFPEYHDRCKHPGADYDLDIQTEFHKLIKIITGLEFNLEKMSFSA